MQILRGLAGSLRGPERYNCIKKPEGAWTWFEDLCSIKHRFSKFFKKNKHKMTHSFQQKKKKRKEALESFISFPTVVHIDIPSNNLKNLMNQCLRFLLSKCNKILQLKQEY